MNEKFERKMEQLSHKFFLCSDDMKVRSGADIFNEDEFCGFWDFLDNCDDVELHDDSTYDEFTEYLDEYLEWYCEYCEAVPIKLPRKFLEYIGEIY